VITPWNLLSYLDLMTITFLSKLFFSMHGDLFKFFFKFYSLLYYYFSFNCDPKWNVKILWLGMATLKKFFSRFSRFQIFFFSDAKMKEESISFTFYCVESFPFQLQDDPAFKTHSCAFCNFQKKKKSDSFIDSVLIPIKHITVTNELAVMGLTVLVTK